MSDGDSIAGSVIDGVKEVGKDIVKQFIGSVPSAAKNAGAQITGTDTQKLEAEKQAAQVVAQQRVRQIEAEIAQIRAQNEQKRGPQVISSQKPEEKDSTTQQHLQAPDEASRQAIGRAEQGRNFKG